MTLSPDGKHWKFALAVYSQPDVADACLYLQDTHGIDVNVLLVSLYSAVRDNREIGAKEIEILDRSIEEQRENLVLPLRSMRRMLKPLPFGPGTERLRSVIKKAELEAEQFEQFCLARKASEFAVGHTADAGEVCRLVVAHFGKRSEQPLSGESAEAMKTISNACDKV